MTKYQIFVTDPLGNVIAESEKMSESDLVRVLPTWLIPINTDEEQLIITRTVDND